MLGNINGFQFIKTNNNGGYNVDVVRLGMFVVDAAKHNHIVPSAFLSRTLHLSYFLVFFIFHETIRKDHSNIDTLPFTSFIANSFLPLECRRTNCAR